MTLYKYLVHAPSPSLIGFSGEIIIMTPNHRKTHLIANIVFMFAFVVHFIIIAYDLKYPQYPSVKIRKTDLRNIHFPVRFKFCVGDIKIKDNLKKLGYVDNYHAFLGISLFNKSLVGWNGHSKDFSTLMPVIGKK